MGAGKPLTSQCCTHRGQFFLYVSHQELSESWKQVLMPETLFASSRAGMRRCQALFGISASSCCLGLCHLLQSWEPAKALCSEQRWESGCPLSYEDQIHLLACVRQINLCSTRWERGCSSPKGESPSFSPSASQSVEAGNWGSSGCFYTRK